MACTEMILYYVKISFTYKKLVFDTLFLQLGSEKLKTSDRLSDPRMIEVGCSTKVYEHPIYGKLSKREPGKEPNIFM